MTYTLDSHKCSAPIPNPDECFLAAQQVIPSSQYKAKTTFDQSLPSGCLARVDHQSRVTVIWNLVNMTGGASSKILKKKDPTKAVTGIALGIVNTTATISAGMDDTEHAVQLTLSGPADQWFGVGFDMEADECPTGGPYAIIVMGDTVVERKLDNHGPGVMLSPSSVESNRHKIFYEFVESSTAIPLIVAKGCDQTFVQHCEGNTVLANNTMMMLR